MKTTRDKELIAKIGDAILHKQVTWGNAWTINWWELFNKKKFTYFVTQVEKGMHVAAAFKQTKTLL